MFENSYLLISLHALCAWGEEIGKGQIFQQELMDLRFFEQVHLDKTYSEIL